MQLKPYVKEMYILKDIYIRNKGILKKINKLIIPHMHFKKI